MRNIPISVLQVVIGVLFGMNVFFVKRLVDEIDQLENMVFSQREQIALNAQSIDNIKKCLARKYGEKIP